MLATQDTIIITAAKIACDGDKESAHPRVFLTVNAEGFVDCPYCGKHYVLDKNAHPHDAH